MAGKMARQIEGIPVILLAERDTHFPTPPRDQRFQDRTSGVYYRYNGAAWVVDITPAAPPSSDGRTVDTVTAYLANNAYYNLLDYGGSGNGSTDNAAILTSLVTSLTALTGGRTIRVTPGRYRLASNVTIPANITLQFDRGATLEPAAATTLTVNGNVLAGPYRIFAGSGSVAGTPSCAEILPEWFQDPSATTWDTAFAAALALCGVATTSSQTRNGRRIKFGVGQYAFANQITITDHNNVVLEGEGGGYIMGFKDVATEILYTGAAAYFLRQSGNYARGLTIKNLAIRYNNASFTGNLIEQKAPGLVLEDVWLGSTGITGSSPETLYTAYSLLHLETNVEACVGSRVVFRGAERAVYIDNGTTGVYGPITFRDCWFYDMTVGFLDTEVLELAKVVLDACTFDVIYQQPSSFGVRVRAHGFDIKGCGFSGEMDKAPTSEWLLVEGSGSIQGCQFRTYYTAIKASNVAVDITGNTFYARCGILVGDGPTILRGGSNEFYGQNTGTRGVDIANGWTAGVVSVDFGPDYFDANLANSYYVNQNVNGATADWHNVHGRIKYDSAFDSSTGGPAYGALVKPESVYERTIEATTNRTITAREYGYTFTNRGAAGSVTFTLPAAVVGAKVTILKVANQTVVVTRAGSDQIWVAGTDSDGVETLTNNTAGQYFASLTLTGFYDPTEGRNIWLPVTTGTWS